MHVMPASPLAGRFGGTWASVCAPVLCLLSGREAFLSKSDSAAPSTVRGLGTLLVAPAVVLVSANFNQEPKGARHICFYMVPEAMCVHAAGDGVCVGGLGTSQRRGGSRSNLCRSGAISLSSGSCLSRRHLVQMAVATCTSRFQEDIVAGEEAACLQHAAKGCQRASMVQGSHAEAVMHAQVKREHQSEGKSFRDILLGGPKR